MPNYIGMFTPIFDAQTNHQTLYVFDTVRPGTLPHVLLRGTAYSVKRKTLALDEDKVLSCAVYLPAFLVFTSRG